MEIIFCHPDIEEFIRLLQSDTYIKVIHVLNLLRNHGYKLRMPHSKQIQDNLFELRCRGRQEVRVLYMFFIGKAFILHIFIKKQQKIPLNELYTAISRKQSVEKNIS